MKINSDTDFEAQDEISFEDKKEIHTMKWVITNTFHELNNIKVEGNIYGGSDDFRINIQIHKTRKGAVCGVSVKSGKYKVSCES